MMRQTRRTLQVEAALRINDRRIQIDFLYLGIGHGEV